MEKKIYIIFFVEITTSNEAMNQLVLVERQVYLMSSLELNQTS